MGEKPTGGGCGVAGAPGPGSCRRTRRPPGTSPAPSPHSLDQVSSVWRQRDAGQTRTGGRGCAADRRHLQGCRLPRGRQRRSAEGLARSTVPHLPAGGQPPVPPRQPSQLPLAAMPRSCATRVPPRLCPPCLSSPSGQRLQLFPRGPSAQGDGVLGLALRGRPRTHECLSFRRSRGRSGASSPLAGPALSPPNLIFPRTASPMP